jgi:hypothetical protein
MSLELQAMPVSEAVLTSKQASGVNILLWPHLHTRKLLPNPKKKENNTYPPTPPLCEMSPKIQNARRMVLKSIFVFQERIQWKNLNFVQ